MRDQWYGDHRDLVKWGTLLEIVRTRRSKHILQVLYYRPSEWGSIEFEGRSIDISSEVIRHFRSVGSIRDLSCGASIEVISEEFADRKRYLRGITAAIQARGTRLGIVFLDPDTGLEPESGNFGPTHVRKNELAEIWGALSTGDVLVLYQHETNPKGEDFIGPKKHQFAQALGISVESAKHAYAPKVARDVVFFFADKG
jgi:hypothetical protein